MDDVEKDLTQHTSTLRTKNIRAKISSQVNPYYNILHTVMEYLAASMLTSWKLVGTYSVCIMPDTLIIETFKNILPVCKILAFESCMNLAVN